MSPSRALVLTGMHRSGTSLLASVARQVGIDMGASLMEGGRGNRRGHFEDLDFHGFHERFLDRRDVSPFAVPHGWSPDPTPAEIEEARELAARRSVKVAWGFKDPRAALFLDFWDGILEAPSYLFVYRHPVEVALSLLRRGLELEVQHDPRVAFRAWTVYNERLLAFRRGHPDRCLLWHVAGATRSLPATVEGLSERLGVPLGLAGLDGLHHPDELIGLQAADLEWETLLPQAFDLYRRLEEEADLPGADLDGVRAGVRPREERELLESNEHLLSAVLRASFSSEDLLESTAARRGEYTRLRLLAAQMEEDNRKLKERIRAAEEERAAIEASTALRIVRLYWSAVEWARAVGRRLIPG